MTDLDYMRMAYQLALKGKGKTSPNPLVGAVIVRGTKVIAQGWHRRCGGDHAEIDALKKVKGPLHKACMYVTLEPCYHYGRTSPCVDQIVGSGIKKVFVSVKDPNSLTNGKSIRKLRRAGIKVEVGLLRDEVTTMNEVFIKYTKTKFPFIAAKCAQTLDGKIATAGGQSKWITSPETRKFAWKIRNEFDAILVGINTVVKDDPQLASTKKIRPLKKVILDSTLRISPKAKLFSKCRPSDCFIATSKKVSAKKRNVFRAKGVNVLECPLRLGTIDMKWLFRELARLEMTSILLEGGAHIVGNALKERLVDKMFIYFAPKIIGDQKALSSIVGMNTNHVDKAIQLKDMALERIGKDILIIGYPAY